VRCATEVGVPVVASFGPMAAFDGTLIRERARCCIEAGAAMIALETFVDMEGLVASTRALAGLPVLASLCPLGGQVRRGEGLSPMTPDDGASLVDVGATMVGVNCGDGVEAMLAAALMLLPSQRPVVFRPSAGLPSKPQNAESPSAELSNAGSCDAEPWNADGTAYPLTADGFAHAARRAWREGIHWVGGCCGVGTRHLQAAQAARRRQISE